MSTTESDPDHMENRAAQPRYHRGEPAAVQLDPSNLEAVPESLPLAAEACAAESALLPPSPFSLTESGWQLPPLEVQSQQVQLVQELGRRYEVIGFLGAGAFASVWRARDRITGETLAIKCFYQVSHQKRESFFREMRALFRLQHPHVVRVINLMEGSAGRRFLFLEWCPGGNLRQVLRSWRQRLAAGTTAPTFPILPFALVATIGSQLATALAAAHGLGMVHRDLKPENILFSETQPTTDTVSESGLGVAKIADFGLVRAMGAAGPNPATPLSGVVGSPAYMAPEQITEPGWSMPANDLYSLGIILYELLHGQVPFLGNITEIARQHLYEPVLFDPLLPEGWQQLLAALLQKDPRQRLTDANQLPQLLQQLHDHPHDTLPKMKDPKATAESSILPKPKQLAQISQWPIESAVPSTALPPVAPSPSSFAQQVAAPIRLPTDSTLLSKWRKEVVRRCLGVSATGLAVHGPASTQVCWAVTSDVGVFRLGLEDLCILDFEPATRCVLPCQGLDGSVWLSQPQQLFYLPNSGLRLHHCLSLSEPVETFLLHWYSEHSEPADSDNRTENPFLFVLTSHQLLAYQIEPSQPVPMPRPCWRCELPEALILAAIRAQTAPVSKPMSAFFAFRDRLYVGDSSQTLWSIPLAKQWQQAPRSWSMLTLPELGRLRAWQPWPDWDSVILGFQSQPRVSDKFLSTDRDSLFKGYCWHDGTSVAPLPFAESLQQFFPYHAQANELTAVRADGAVLSWKALDQVAFIGFIHHLTGSRNVHIQAVNRCGAAFAVLYKEADESWIATCVAS